MSQRDDRTDALDAAFAAARAHPAEPDPAFLARVLESAEAVQAEIAAAQAAPPARAPERGARGIFRALGGWPAMAGLASAVVTGVWIGVAPPAPLSTTAQMVLGGDVTLAFEPDLGTELFPGEEG